MSESFFEARKKKFAVLVVASAKALTPPPPPSCERTLDFVYMYEYMYVFEMDDFEEAKKNFGSKGKFQYFKNIF